MSFIEGQEKFDRYAYVNRVQEAFRALYPADFFEILPLLSFGNLRNSSFSKCYNQIGLLVNGTRNGAVWALKMIDASSKISSGILMGNNIDLGMYDECMDINEIENGEIIRGRHCMYNVEISSSRFNVKEAFSICLPSSCGPEDVQALLEGTLEKINGLVEIPIDIIGTTCSSIVAADWTTGGIVTLVGFSLWLFFLLICTICDIFVRHSSMDYESSGVLDFICQFSVYSNAIRVLNMKKNPQTFPAVQGLRFFSMCWVIFGHEYYTVSQTASINPLEFFKWVHTWSSLYILIAPFAVDTFFTISGFLMSYLFLKEMSTGRRFNILAYYVHRYLRLTPALVALLLMTIFILPRVGSGALWEPRMNAIAKNCRNKWWSLMIYVQNYLDAESSCLAHTWYLAVEMHFFWISPTILYPLAKKPRIGLVILALGFIASVIAPAVISYENEYSGYVIAADDLAKSKRIMENFYKHSHVRAAPWLIGVFFGYLVFAQKGFPGRMIKLMGWLLTMVAFAFSFFIMRKFQAKEYVYDAFWETFYVVVSKPFWSGGVAWIIYASVCDFGGPITAFLSHSIYNPFCRISYCVYLIHFSLLIMKASAIRVPRYINEFSFFNDFLSDFLLCIIFGFIFTLIFESPILILERIVRRRGRKKLNESKQKLEHEEVESGIDNPELTRAQRLHSNIVN